MNEYTLDYEIFDKLKGQIIDEFTQKLISANANGELGELLDKNDLTHSLDQYLEITNQTKEIPSLKYALVGGHNIDKQEVYKIFYDFGITEEQVDLSMIGYDTPKRKNVPEYFKSKLDKYKAIFVGECHHKCMGIGDSRDLYSALQKLSRQELAQTKVEKLTKSATNAEMHFSNSALVRALDLLHNDENNIWQDTNFA